MIFIVNRVINLNKYNNFVICNNDRLKTICCFNFFCELKSNYKLLNFDKLLFSFLNNCRLLYLCSNKVSNLLNTYVKYFDYFIDNCLKKDSIKILESVNFFCKFSYSGKYNKLVFKFSKYDIKVIVFNSYGNVNSSLLFNNFVNVNEKNDKIYIIDNYFNSFSNSIRNDIRRQNDYTGKGIRYMNELFSVKIRKKIK